MKSRAVLRDCRARPADELRPGRSADQDGPEPSDRSLDPAERALNGVAEFESANIKTTQ